MIALLRTLVFFVFAWILLRALGRVLPLFGLGTPGRRPSPQPSPHGGGGRQTPAVPPRLLSCAVCGVRIPESSARKVVRDGEEVIVCSEECRAKI